VCGYLGMVAGLQPTSPMEGDAYDQPYSLPRSLEDALRLLNACEPLREHIGERFVLAFNAVKEQEFNNFLQVISSWEREYLLLNV
jgi:glutamine synthetase